MSKKLKNFLILDFETLYSDEYSLRKMTTPEYILDPRFQVTLLAAFDIKWPAPRIVEAHEIPEFLAQYPADETVACSHNALFDMAILSWRYDWVPARLQDTLGMARALRRYKSNSLGAVAKALFGTDTKGDVLPKVKGMDARAIKQAGLWPAYRTYAMNDARICSQIYFKLYPEFPPEEQKVMDLVLRAGICPVLQADTAMLEKHLIELRNRKAQLLRECGYDKAALMSTMQFQQALEDLGVEIKTKLSATNRIVPAFAKSDPFMAELLEYQESEDDDINYQVQTLAAARLSQKSTIEETRAQKFVNIARLPWGTGSLLPVPLRYGGAHTHRLSGEWGMNMQNLPRDKVKSRLRAALRAPPGYKLVTADLSQIEARLVARLCRQDDLLEQFAKGEDVYASFASRVFGVAVDKKNYPDERFIGKTAILGLGYGCGVERFYSMVVAQARQYGILLDELSFDRAMAQQIVDTYRRTFSRIAISWKLLDRHLANILNSHNRNAMAHWGPVTFTAGRIALPNGMALQYVIGDQHLYGAKLLENITQALARIVVMQAAVRLSQLGYRFVLQAHDELVFVIRDADVDTAKQVISDEMVRELPWLPGVPLAVELGVGQTYGDAK